MHAILSHLQMTFDLAVIYKASPSHVRVARICTSLALNNNKCVSDASLRDGKPDWD